VSSHQFLTLAELAEQLGRDKREIEKLVARGRIPAHRTEGDWRFHPAEIRHWLEQEMRGFTADELAQVESSQSSSEADAEIPVTSLLAPEAVQVPLEARTKRSVLESLIEIAGRTWQVWEPAALMQAVLERETVMSTAFENGVAIPHPRNPLPQALGASLIAYGRTFSGIPFGAPQRGLTDVFFLVLCRDSWTHLHVLARLGRLLQRPGFLDALRTADDAASSYDVIRAADLQISQA
jgi:PTS system nitrogen regulatory IIA component